VEPVRQWRYLRRVVRMKRKLKALVYQLTELHPTRYTGRTILSLRQVQQLTAAIWATALVASNASSKDSDEKRYRGFVLFRITVSRASEATST
jgi:hypothetical protein